MFSFLIYPIREDIHKNINKFKALDCTHRMGMARGKTAHFL